MTYVLGVNMDPRNRNGVERQEKGFRTTYMQLGRSVIEG